MTIDDTIADFDVLDSWDDRYRYVIELGRKLAPLAEAAHNEKNKVLGCASQVWLVSEVKSGANGPVLEFCGDSDAHIVKGLIAILFALYSGQPARKILDTDAIAVFKQLGLGEHLTPQRSNGFRSMVERMRADAQAALTRAA
jgi:cysteine desulfuration protein SufE